MPDRDFARTLWHATAGPRPETAPLRGDRRVDVAVVGAGFTGLCAALRLAEAGARVAVVEAREIGWGATGRNAGFVVPNFAKVDPDDVVARLGPERGERLIDLVGRGGDAVFGLIRRHGIACDGVQGGWVQPAHSPAALDRLRRRCEQWAARGRPVEFLDRDRVAEATGCRRFAGGWIDRSGGTIHPLDYAYGLARAALAAGADIHEATPVAGLERDGVRWRLATPSGTVTAGRVLLCTNAYVGRLHGGLARSLIPLHVHQIATEPLPPEVRGRLLRGAACVSDTRNDLFTFRLDRGGRLVSGGMAAVQFFGARARMARRIVRRLAAMLDLPSVPRVEFAWRGTAAVTTDFLPRLHELGPGLLAGIGCNGRGIAMTTMLGRVLADAALGVRLDELPIPPTRVEPLPFHFLSRHAPAAAIPLGRWRDFRTARSG